MPAACPCLQLVSALLYHIVPGSQTAEQLLAFGTLPTELANVTLTVRLFPNWSVARQPLLHGGTHRTANSIEGSQQPGQRAA